MVAGLLDGTLLVVEGGEEEVGVVVGVDDVVGGGVDVVVHVLVVVGGGGVYVDVGVVEVVCESPEEPNSQLPERTPASRDPKN